MQKEKFVNIITLFVFFLNYTEIPFILLYNLNYFLSNMEIKLPRNCLKEFPICYQCYCSFNLKKSIISHFLFININKSQVNVKLKTLNKNSLYLPSILYKKILFF